MGSFQGLRHSTNLSECPKRDMLIIDLATYFRYVLHGLGEGDVKQSRGVDMSKATDPFGSVPFHSVFPRVDSFPGRQVCQ